MAALESGENIILTQADVAFARSVEGEDGESGVQEVGVGTLIVTTQRIVWTPTGAGEVFSIAAVSLQMHAVSREGVETFARPCMYCQLDESAGLPAEVFFAPKEDSTLEATFRAFSQTALINPPPDDEEDEGGMFGGEMGEGFYGEVDDEFVRTDDYDDNSGEPLPSAQDREAMLAHLDSILQVPAHLEVREPSQFDDAAMP